METLTFKSEDEIVQKAQMILANRCYIPADAKPIMNNRIHKNENALLDHLALTLAGQDIETNYAFYFSPDGKLIKQACVSRGNEKSCDSNIREVARQGLLCNATAVVIAHNHPNGDPVPSSADSKVAAQTAVALSMVGMDLIGAYVVAGPTRDKVTEVEPPMPSYGSNSSLSKSIAAMLGIN